jgi:xanthine dehydrogenase YagR molybdenum-binding subunit
MKFDSPATTNPIDQLKIIGHSTSRIDGPLKTTGKATYAYEWHDLLSTPAYGYIVGSAIAKGRITSLDISRAKAASGVIAVVTAESAGKLGKGKYNAAKLLGGPEIDHYHQAVAVVVAETFEQARSAAELVKVGYEEAKGSFDLAAGKGAAGTAPARGEDKPESSVGDFVRSVRCRARATGCHLHHARSGSRNDGAACVDRGLEWGKAYPVDVQPDDRLDER